MRGRYATHRHFFAEIGSVTRCCFDGQPTRLATRALCSRLAQI